MLGVMVALAACQPMARFMARGEPAEHTTGWSLLGLGYDLDNGWPDVGHEIYGLRLSLLGARHRDVYGLDVALFRSVRDHDGGGVAISARHRRCRCTT
jgi:hypothetical protein